MPPVLFGGLEGLKERIRMNKNNGKLLALLVATAMVAMIFNGASGLARNEPEIIFEAGAASGVSRNVALDAEMVNAIRDGINFVPPVETDSVIFDESFEDDILGDVPDDPPWMVTESPSSAYSEFAVEQFEDDVVGSNPDNPPWETSEGSSATMFWGSDMEDTTVGQSLTGYFAGDAGGFATFTGDVALTAQTPPAGAPAGSIYAGLTTGTMCALFNEGADTAAESYFGPAGVGDTPTTAYAGSWVRFPATTTRTDFYLYDYATGGAAMFFVFFGGTVYHFPNNVQTVLTTYAANTWYEFYVEYDEPSQTYSVWWNGGELGAGSAWTDATMVNVDSMIWYGGEVSAQPSSNMYFDNWFHFIPPAGTADTIGVSNAWSYSGSGGAQSVFLDQAASTHVASTQTYIAPPYCFGPEIEYNWVARTSTPLANSNGAMFSLMDFNQRAIVQIRFSGGQIQYNNAGTWTNLMAFAASTEYVFYVAIDGVSKTCVVININTVDIVTNVALANRGSGLAGFRLEGTAGTQSEIYFDDVYFKGSIQEATVRISDDYANDGAQSAHMLDAAGDAATDMAAYLGGEFVTYGEIWFWFYGDGTLGGGSVYVLDSTQSLLVTIISLGTDLTAAAIPHPGQIKFVDGDGGGGGMVVDGPTFTEGAWNNVSIRYDTLAGTFEAFWNGASQGTFGILEAAPDAGICFFFGEGAAAPTDFYFDSVGMWVDDLPEAPTNLRVYGPGPSTRTDNYYTVDQDNPVQGTVSNDYTNIDEISPFDGNLEMVTEAFVGGSGGTVQYTYTGVTQATNNHYAYWCDINSVMSAAGPVYNVQTEATDANYGQITTSEDTRWIGTDPGNTDYTFMQSEVQVAENPAYITEIFMSCEIQGDAATDFQIWAEDGTGAWAMIGTALAGAADTDVTIGRAITANCANYIVGGYLTWGVFQTDASDLVRTDRMNVTITWAEPTYNSLEHRWRTQSVPAGADYMEVSVRASCSSGADDSFVFGISTVLAGPYTTFLTVSIDQMTSYKLQVPVTSGVLYINVVDSSSSDANTDTIFIDLITIHWADVSGSTVQNQLTSADNAVVGTVTGTHVLTQSIPGDASAQQITEVAAAGTDTLIDEGFEGAFLPAGWTQIDQDGDGYMWYQTDGAGQPANSGTYAAWSASYDNTAGALTPDNYLITYQIDLVDYSAATLTWYDAAQDPAWAGERYQVRISTTTPTATAFTNLVADYTLTTDAYTQRTASLTPYVGNMIYITWEHCLCTDMYQLKIDDILLTADMSGNNAEHRWTMQNMPANTLDNTLYVTARTSAAADDAFAIGWSQNLAGPYATLVTITATSFTTYSASMPTTFSGTFYINVRATVGGDAVADSVYIDMLYVRCVVSPVNTTVNLMWDISADDGAGQNDVTGYNIYYSDAEFGGTSDGTFNYLDSVGAGIGTYMHYGEADDMVNNIWYIVSAEDPHSEGFTTGRATKFNVAPLTSGVLVDGVIALDITAGTPSVSLVANIYDDTSTWEDILKIDEAEWYDTTDPGVGLGTPLNNDGAYDAVSEPVSYTIDTSAWAGGTNHQIFVRGHEAAPGNTGNGWGAAVSVWINVTGSTPSFTIAVVAGWNLVSTPFIPLSSVMPAALTDIDADTTWTRAMSYNPTTPGDPWKQYNTAWASLLNDLTTVDEKMGVWIFVNVVGDGLIHVSGVQPVTTAITLNIGWNLVGFPSDDAAYTVGMLKGDCPSVTLVERFDGAQTYMTSTMLDAEVLATGQGYWVYSSAMTTWNKAW